MDVLAAETFTRPEGFTIASVLERLGTGDPHTAQVAVPLDSAHWLRSRPGTTLLADSPWQREGWEVLGVSYREPELMADDVAAMGAQALVVSPPALRDAVAGRLHRAAPAAAAETGSLDGWFPGWRARQPRRRIPGTGSSGCCHGALPGGQPRRGGSEVLAEFNISAKEWERDLDTLNVSGLPGYLWRPDGCDHGSRPGLHQGPETLASPLRLTQEEACSVLVGLQALTALPGAERRRSRRRLRPWAQWRGRTPGWRTPSGLS